MGQILHGSARTTAAVRRAIQHSQESLKRLAARYSINAKTVAKWRKRSFVEDAPMGPAQPRSTTLSLEEETMAVAFRKHTLLALDDCLYALQASIPHLTRSALHRCFQRHGISRLPAMNGAESLKKKRFKPYPIGYFHIDLTEVRTGQGKLYLFVAIDRTSKFAFAKLVEQATRRAAGDFLQELIALVPYQIHTVLTDNGTHFTTPGNLSSAASDIRRALNRGELFRSHCFEWTCAKNHIEHRLTKPNHPWTNGQVERMNRTLKEATVHTYHYDNHDRLREHLRIFLNAYNFAKRLKTLSGLTPFQFISQCWQNQPHRFRLNPFHLSLGLNS
jgi:transposase InsO family protein